MHPVVDFVGWPTVWSFALPYATHFREQDLEIYMTFFTRLLRIAGGLGWGRSFRVPSFPLRMTFRSADTNIGAALRSSS